MVHVKTSCGFEMDADKIMFDDMELLDAVADVDNGHPERLPYVVNKIVGDRKKDLYDLLRGEDGRVPISKIKEPILEIINQVAGKNT